MKSWAWGNLGGLDHLGVGGVAAAQADVLGQVPEKRKVFAPAIEVMAARRLATWACRLRRQCLSASQSSQSRVPSSRRASAVRSSSCR